MTEEKPSIPPQEIPMQPYAQPYQAQPNPCIQHYPQIYYPPPPKKSSVDLPLVALILSAVGLVYPFPPLVLPIVALCLVHKAKSEMKAGRVFESKDVGTQLKVAKILSIVGIVWGILMLAYMAFFFSLFFDSLGHYHRGSVGQPVACGDNLTVTVDKVEFLGGSEEYHTALMEGHDYVVLELSFTNNEGTDKELSYKDIYIEREISDKDYNHYPIDHPLDSPKVPKLFEGAVEPNQTVTGYVVFDVKYRFGADLYFRYEPTEKERVVVPLD